MLKVCKIRIYPNSSQTSLILSTLGCCRYIKNLYIEKNKKYYEKTGEFLTAYDFSKWINREKKEEDGKYSWIKKYSSKAIKDAIMIEEKAFKKFFKKKGGYPKFHSKRRTHRESFFFEKKSIHYTDNPNIIKLPILGKVRITDHSYLPPITSISSGRVVREYNKFYVMFIYDTPCKNITKNHIDIGMDVGIKNYVCISLSTGGYEPIHYTEISHFRDGKRYKELKGKIVRLQQIISHKVEINYGRLLNQYLDTHYGEEPCKKSKNMMKGESYHTSQIRRLQRKIRKLFESLRNIRRDFIYKLVNMITARIKPKSITVENLSISEMTKHDGTKNTKLHMYIQESGFYMFEKEVLANKCMEYGITLRIAKKYFASSKLCNHCGNKKEDLSLNDRVYICERCGMTMDRDRNASTNLLKLKDKDCDVYKFA